MWLVVDQVKYYTYLTYTDNEKLQSHEVASGTTDKTRRATRHGEMAIKAAADNRMDAPDRFAQIDSKRQKISVEEIWNLFALPKHLGT